MVLDKKFLLIIVLSIFIKKSICQTAADYVYCDTAKSFTATGKPLFIYFSEPGSTKTTCNYLINSPIDTYISVELYHNLAGTGTSCTTQYVEISPNGDPRFRTGVKYCGFRGVDNPLRFNTIGNEVRFRVVSNDLQRTVQIRLTAYNITQANCSCSWNPSIRVANGQNTAATTFTANAVLKTMIGKFYEAICGATIISYKYSITAAHCVTYAKTFGLTNVHLHVGRQNVTADVYADTVYSEQYIIAAAETHPSYNSNTKANDIGYIKTTRDIRYSKGVGPACISYQYEFYPLQTGTTLTAIGFGATEFAMGATIDKKSWILQSARLIVNQSLATGCNQLQKVCCQGDLVANGGRGDTCQRDSGSGIYAYMKNNLYYFAALTSEGLDCGMRDSYSINVNVPTYIPWIKGVLGNEMLCDKQII